MENTLKLEELSAVEIGNLVNSKIITPTQVLDYFFKRIKERNKSINAFVYIKEEDAYKRAKELEEKLNKNEYVGPFAGVPFCLKDFLPSKKGWTASHGGVSSLITTDVEDSEFCKAMEAAGGIAIGKTNAPSFGFRGTCDNKMYGPTSTPFNTQYNSGGSSGGTAAAVADGLVPIGEGGDAGGSIRVPASWCNLFGFKPSAGLIVNYCRPDAWTATHPFCCNGALTKSVLDEATLLNYMVRYDNRDPYSTKCDIDFIKALNKDIKNIKIGYSYNLDLYPLSDEVKKVFDKRINELKKAGFNLEEVKMTWKHDLNFYSDYWQKSISFDTAIELTQMKENGLDFFTEKRNEVPEEFISIQEDVKNSDIFTLFNINLIKTEILDKFLNVLNKYDILLTPTTICPPVKNATNFNTKGPCEINGVKIDSLIAFCETFLINFIGFPAASIPMGLTDNNLPLGMQIVANKFSDDTLLAFAKKYEELFPWKDFFKIVYERKN